MSSVLLLMGLVWALNFTGASIDHDLYEAQLDATQVVPPIDLPGMGSLVLIYDTEELSDPHYCFISITYWNLSGPPTSASMHWGREGENGSLAFTLVSGTFASPRDSAAYIPLDVINHLYYDQDSLYVVIATDAYPEGEVRGHLRDMTPPAVAPTSWGRIREGYR